MYESLHLADIAFLFKLSLLAWSRYYEGWMVSIVYSLPYVHAQGIMAKAISFVHLSCIQASERLVGSTKLNIGWLHCASNCLARPMSVINTVYFHWPNISTIQHKFDHNCHLCAQIVCWADKMTDQKWALARTSIHHSQGTDQCCRMQIRCIIIQCVGYVLYRVLVLIGWYCTI